MMQRFASNALAVGNRSTNANQALAAIWFGLREGRFVELSDALAAV